MGAMMLPQTFWSYVVVQSRVEIAVSNIASKEASYKRWFPIVITFRFSMMRQMKLAPRTVK